MKLSLVLVPFLLICSCNTKKDINSKQNFHSGISWLSTGLGHEYLTVYSAEIFFNTPHTDRSLKVKNIIGVKSETLANFPRSATREDTNGFAIFERSPLILGAATPDWLSSLPELPVQKEWSTFDHNNYPTNDKEWQNDERLMKLHFLRNKINGQFVSAKQACFDSTESIKTNSKFAIKYAKNKNLNHALGFMGVALHTIQDSFSQAHSVRDQDWNLKDICNYGSSNKDPNICYHGIITHDHVGGGGNIIADDKIFKNDLKSLGYNGLKDEAKKAVYAGAEYLGIVGYYVHLAMNEPQNSQNSEEAMLLELDRFFTMKKNGKTNGFGLFDCSKITK